MVLSADGIIALGVLMEGKTFHFEMLYGRSAGALARCRAACCYQSCARCCPSTD